jgi:hypothetical protein
MGIDLTIRVATLCVGFFGFALTIVTLYFNYERGRRELAVRLMIDWANNADVATKYSMRLAACLADDQIRSIWKREGVQIPAKHLDLVLQLLAEGFDQVDQTGLCKDSEGSVTIQPRYAQFIEYHWTRYLNRLESTLVAWDSHVANEAMMERQFRKVMSSKVGLLKNLTRLDPESEDGPCYPTVVRFLNKIDKNEALPRHGTLVPGAVAIVLAAAVAFAYLLWVALKGGAAS